MKEELLHYFWRTHRWRDQNIFTTDGQPLQIIVPGDLNKDAGPDFSNAKIRIGDELWIGNIEIHVKASEWYLHQHQYDPQYKTVILHVVWSEDQQVYFDGNRKIPCFELKNIISKDIIDNYERLMNSAFWIACENQVDKIDMQKAALGLNAKLIEKLQDKTTLLEHIYSKTNGDWNETFHRFLARGFGLNVNGTAFELLAEKLPLELIRKYTNDTEKLEAVVFGIAGFLNNASEDYAIKLKGIFESLPKNNLPEILPEGVFKFFRARPSNFPTIRIAQWIKLISDHDLLLNEVVSMSHPDEFINFICSPLNGFWQNHFTFSATSNGFPTKAGKEFAKLLLINSVAPFLFFYGKKLGNIELQQTATDWLDEIKGEKNTIIKKFQELGFPTSTAAQTQGLLHLKKKYCECKRCLECPFGAQIFRS